eukprot:scaffold304_cov248-Pinguiococcus_pyrenoidosus.AAC.27
MSTRQRPRICRCSAAGDRFRTPGELTSRFIKSKYAVSRNWKPAKPRVVCTKTASSDEGQAVPVCRWINPDSRVPDDQMLVRRQRSLGASHHVLDITS